ncbi:MAG: carbohydrate ABC transporter permease [Clostridia bacterium]|nr:carbohydrate ABC transporter permease [Clostridia bacterium]
MAALTLASRKKHIRTSGSDLLFDIIVMTVMILFLLICLYPLFFILIASISDPVQVSAGRVLLIPRGITLDGFARIFRYQKLWTGYWNTIVYTVIGTTINVAITIMAGYALSRKDLKGRRPILLIFSFTMFFSGGMIPTYMVVNGLNLIDKIWAMVLPNAMSVWNLMIARSYFETTIPDELLDAAFIDGCGNLRFFRQIVLPLSKAIVSVMVLFYAIGHWNAFFNALIYLTTSTKFPLQLVLRDILIAAQPDATMMEDIASLVEKQKLAELLKYGVIIVASVPVLILYPFVQRYFVTGIMVGSIKG